MKIVCDCGNEMEFIADVTDPFTDSEGYEHLYPISRTIDIASGHDELFIGCTKCGKKVHIWA